MRKFSIIIASMFIFLGDLHAQIWYSESNANVLIDTVGTDRYRVTITPTAFGATVILDADGTNDTIEEIRVNQYSEGTAAVLLESLINRATAACFTLYRLLRQGL